MKTGQIILFPFPNTDMSKGKFRPALLVGKLPGHFEDWLICMISSRLHHQVPHFDEIISPEDEDFQISGLHSKSLIRVGRMAIVDSSIFAGTIGEISPARMDKIKGNLASWLVNL